MARTINRQPISVPYPSEKQTKDYFFNHYTWKGINDDKNFLEVDQETFNDCHNVYVDSEGLLRSRPALKRKEVTLYDKEISDNTKTEIAELSTITDFWVFGDIIVYRSDNNTTQKTSLFFTKNSKLYRTSTNTYTFQYNYVSSAPIGIKLVLSKGKIFIFTELSFEYFDITTYTFGSATNFIYVPITKRITTSTETDFESKNTLTTSEKYVYLYNNATGINTDVIGKTVKVTIDGTTYDVVFTEYTPNVLAEVYFNVNSIYSTTELEYAESNKCGLSIAISVDNVIAMYSYTSKYCLITTDGLTFNSYYFDEYDENLNGALYQEPRFSNSGDILYICTNRGIFVLSVKSTSEYGLQYPIFTNILNEASYSSIKSDYIMAYKPDDSSQNKNAGALFVGFVDYTTFAVCIFWTKDNLNLQNIKQLQLYKVINSTVASVTNSSIANDYFTPSSGLLTDVATITTVETEIEIGLNSYTCDMTVVLNTNWKDLTVIAWSSDDGTILAVQAQLANISNSIGFFSKKNKIFYNYLSTLLSYDATGVSYGIAKLYIPLNGIQLSSSFTTKNIYPTDTASFDNNYTNSDLFFFGSDDVIVFSQGIYYWSSEHLEKFINGDEDNGAFVVEVTDRIYYLQDSASNKLFVTRVSDAELTYTKSGSFNYLLPSHVAELHNFYFAKDNSVYISQDAFDASKNWQWYLPEKLSQKFNYEINALHPISDDVMAVFMEPEIDYIAYDKDAKAYTYQKSKLQVGLPKGNNVITSLDGTTILFVTKRGLVGLGYQDFIASTEQALSYLSDSIYQIFADWNTSSIRLHLFGFWLICHKRDSDNCYIYDIRTKSWWHCRYDDHISYKFVTFGTALLYLADNTLFYMDRTDGKVNEDGDDFEVTYFDDDGNKQTNIDWSLTSQKLYLSAANYYKHIVNITLNFAVDVVASKTNKKPTMNLIICNYRKIRNIVDQENFEYTVDMIRTLVHRLNFAKVCEFQYQLSSDSNNVVQIPLSLADITVKYKVSGEVR